MEFNTSILDQLCGRQWELFGQNLPFGTTFTAFVPKMWLVTLEFQTACTDDGGAEGMLGFLQQVVGLKMTGLLALWISWGVFVISVYCHFCNLNEMSGE